MLRRCLIALLCVNALIGCASVTPSALWDNLTEPAAVSTPQNKSVHELLPKTWLQGDNGTAIQWQHFTFPSKLPTVYKAAVDDGRDAVWAQSAASSSMLRRTVNLSVDQFQHIHFSWKVPYAITMANVSVPADDDSPVRIVLTFEGDRSKFSFKNAMVSELAHLVLGEPLPYATLVYVWSDHHPLETVITSPRTDRVRSIVVESGKHRLNKWRDYTRNVRADYEKVFGETPGKLLTASIMTDSDNTQSQSVAWYGALKFQ